MSYINGGSVVAVGVLFPVVGTVAVAARFYALVTGCAVSLIVGAAGHTIGYHSKPDQNAGNDERIVFMEKVRPLSMIVLHVALNDQHYVLMVLFKHEMSYS
ncbi:uncharacterized protein KY384_008550 [Bacidia gigantensis]|uniref:uncharacterized protein n=1 Tax=Bacidia gigantensis TaxID=2732470 RepID=UPI001D059290|nr:uncharacterized protein KY384_008550 [Bacidia gigantensis]KAG8527121.1 hypothetical protein KY384_008550 [Bacidia gigantensis]